MQRQICQHRTEIHCNFLLAKKFIEWPQTRGILAISGNRLQQQNLIVNLICSGSFCLRKPNICLGSQVALGKPKEELLTYREREGKRQVQGVWLYPGCLGSIQRQELFRRWKGLYPVRLKTGPAWTSTWHQQDSAQLHILNCKARSRCPSSIPDFQRSQRNRRRIPRPVPANGLLQVL